MSALVRLQEEARELTSYFLSYEDTAIRQHSVNQEEGTYQELTMLAT